MNAHTAHHPDLDEETRNCHNCGAAVSYHHCAVCGQETKLHVASAREFLHEFVGHYVALEGKLWHTLWLLLARPGALTADYIAGRRARYVQPLRIYLTFSILFFALLKYSPSDVAFGKTPAATPPAASAPAQGAAKVSADEAAADKAAVEQGSPNADNIKLNTRIGELNPAWEVRLRQIWVMPQAERARVLKSAFFSYVPYAVFCLMPLFALFLKLLYLGSGRRYGEHLLFALHANAFAFIMFGLIYSVASDWLRAGLFLWLMCYLPIAMRRVYGGSRMATGVRWCVLMLIHLCSIFSAIACTMFFALIA